MHENAFFTSPSTSTTLARDLVFNQIKQLHVLPSMYDKSSSNNSDNIARSKFDATALSMLIYFRSTVKHLDKVLKNRDLNDQILDDGILYDKVMHKVLNEVL